MKVLETGSQSVADMESLADRVQFLEDHISCYSVSHIPLKERAVSEHLRNFNKVKIRAAGGRILLYLCLYPVLWQIV